MEAQATTAGVLHPGAMGQTVGATLRASGARVLFTSEGRSGATRSRAEAVGLLEEPRLAGLIERCDVLVSVCPPEAALDLASQVAELGFGGSYVDANAVSPDTARALAERIERAGGRFVDGGIVGPPARRPGTTRLYLSGATARQVQKLFCAGPLEAIVIEGAPGAASALKMAYAAYTKGTQALLLAIRALARHEGVAADLLGEWARSNSDAAARSAAAARTSPPKAWRFVGEMHEIARSFEAAGLPGEFHRAAAEVYARLASYKDAEAPPSLDDVIETLLKPASR